MIKFQDETNDPMDHQKHNIYCQACCEKSTDRECEFCGGVVHIEKIPGVDTEILQCDSCDFNVRNESKYF